MVVGKRNEKFFNISTVLGWGGGAGVCICLRTPFSHFLVRDQCVRPQGTKERAKIFLGGATGTTFPLAYLVIYTVAVVPVVLT